LIGTSAAVAAASTLKSYSWPDMRWLGKLLSQRIQKTIFLVEDNHRRFKDVFKTETVIVLHCF
jgi:hypothetical protein